MSTLTLIALGFFALSGLALLAAVLVGRRGGKDASVEELMPVADIRGHWAFMKDGSFRCCLKWPGRSLSISTEDERIAFAVQDSKVLGSLEQQFAIAKLPERVRSNRQLELVNAAIDREQEEYQAPKSAEAAEACRIRLKLIEDHLKEDAINESMHEDHLEWPAYLVVCFPKGTEIERAQEDMDIFMRRARESVDEPPYYLDEAGIRHMYQLYFTPDSVSDVAEPAGIPVRGDFKELLRGYSPKEAQ